MDRGRLRLKQMLKHNRETYRQAIRYPEVRLPRSVKVTIPCEFSLSCPATPARSVCGDSDNESVCSDWSSSLRKSSRASSPERSTRRRKGVKPALTVPVAPALHTANRARSATPRCGERAKSSDPGRLSKSAGRSKPVQRHNSSKGSTACAEGSEQAPTRQWVAPQRRRAKTDGAAQDSHVTTAEERYAKVQSALARADSDKARLCVFRKPTAHNKSERSARNESQGNVACVPPSSSTCAPSATSKPSTPRRECSPSNRAEDKISGSFIRVLPPAADP